MKGKHSFDGIDLFTGYKTFIRSGSDGFLESPVKERYKRDWGDENGIEVDLKHRALLQSKTVALDCFMMASSASDFFRNYKLLENHLAEPGLRRFYVAEFERSFYVYFDGITGVQKFSSIARGCAFTINLVEPVPSRWMQFSFLTNEDRKVLLFPDGIQLIADL